MKKEKESKLKPLTAENAKHNSRLLYSILELNNISGNLKILTDEDLLELKKRIDNELAKR